uniref:Uncharacterized protein n=1 Tax=uncultured Thiotrichaceae bacterium TaxID=298394 RepID=A0A6S6UK76_9GAMM|nr:MAG: Unknown protein [uncultured Thiotrichaceae bacterium]
MNIKKELSKFSTYFVLTIFIALGVSNTALATVKSVTGQLKLRAIIDNRPAFSSVSWEISLRKAGVQKVIKTVKQHTATIELEPGTYQIILSAKDKARTRSITIVESKLHDLVINLD